MLLICREKREIREGRDVLGVDVERVKTVKCAFMCPSVFVVTHGSHLDFFHSLFSDFYLHECRTVL